jgi:hypothetical protein
MKIKTRGLPEEEIMAYLSCEEEKRHFMGGGVVFFGLNKTKRCICPD